MSEEILHKKFGNLTVISEASMRGTHRYYLCECDCGKRKEIRSHRLRKGITKSCGCLVKKKTGDRFRSHGCSLTPDGKETRLHRIWANMKARCTVLTHQSYKNYGGRGITVCEEWLNDYMSFHNWAVNNGYFSNLTIERKDNNGGYNADNCTWVTKGQNGRNQRSTKLTEENVSKIRSLYTQGLSRKELSTMFGISRNHIVNILNNNRWKKAA